MKHLVRRIQTAIFLRVSVWKISRSAKKILRMPTPLALERITRIRWQICSAISDTPLRDGFLHYMNQIESIVKNRTP